MFNLSRIEATPKICWCQGKAHWTYQYETNYWLSSLNISPGIPCLIWCPRRVWLFSGKLTSLTHSASLQTCIQRYGMKLRTPMLLHRFCVRRWKDTGGTSNILNARERSVTSHSLRSVSYLLTLIDRLELCLVNQILTHVKHGLPLRKSLSSRGIMII